jgi:hypothetical protein
MEEREDLFRFDDIVDGFDKSLTDIMRNLIEQKRTEFMSHDNIISYNHGLGWLDVREGDTPEIKKFEVQSHEEIIHFDDVLDNNIYLLPQNLIGFVTGMHDNFLRMMMRTIHEATERSGNVINAKSHDSVADAFLEALRTIEFGIKEDGSVSVPEFMASGEVLEKLHKDSAGREEELREIVESIKKEKTQEALRREESRKSRFKPVIE